VGWGAHSLGRQAGRQGRQTNRQAGRQTKEDGTKTQANKALKFDDSSIFNVVSM
jgi:hypothetical protein